MTNVIKMPIADLEDRLVNTRALLNFALASIEGAEPEDFTRMKSDYCTMFYLLRDQVAGMEKDCAVLFKRDMLSTAQDKGKRL